MMSATVEGCPNYEIMSSGEVLNVKTNRWLRPSRTRKGYWQITLLDEDRQRRTFLIHTLVFNAFADTQANELGKRHIYHVNGDKSDNRIENLAERGIYREAKNTDNIRVLNGYRRVVIRETGESFSSVRTMCAHLDLDISTVYKVLRGERASHNGMSFDIIIPERAQSYLRLYGLE